jgi:hypothetical protein
VGIDAPSAQAVPLVEVSWRDSNLPRGPQSPDMRGRFTLQRVKSDDAQHLEDVAVGVGGRACEGKSAVCGSPVGKVSDSQSG